MTDSRQRSQYRAHYLQTVPFEGPGRIADWLSDAGYAVHGTHLYETDLLPQLDEFDLLVVMGGPMSVNDESVFPWLTPTKALLRDSIGRGKRVLGVCLGAQLIASALGARVYRSPVKEIGWFPIHGLTGVPLGACVFPADLTVFHWHGETFDLPVGAIHLASSAVCQNQAFQLGNSVIGLQFHLEVTPERVQEMIRHGRTELKSGPCVQTDAELLSASSGKYETMHSQLGFILTYLTSQ